MEELKTVLRTNKLTPDEEDLLAAANKVEATLKREKLSDACSRCESACCRMFRIKVRQQVLPHRGNGRRKPWHKRLRIVWPESDPDSAFASRHFKPIQRPLNATILRHVMTPAERQNGVKPHKLKCLRRRALAYIRRELRGLSFQDVWLTCDVRKGNRCGAYDERPVLCQTHLCDAAMFHKTPLEAGHGAEYPGCVAKTRRQYAI